MKEGIQYGEVYFENLDGVQFIGTAKSLADALEIAGELNSLLKMVEDNMNSPEKFKDAFGEGPQYFGTEGDGKPHELNTLARLFHEVGYKADEMRYIADLVKSLES